MFLSCTCYMHVEAFDNMRLIILHGNEQET